MHIVQKDLNERLKELIGEHSGLMPLFFINKSGGVKTVKKVNPRDISKIYRIYGELQNLRKKQETMSPAEVLNELYAMQKVAAKIKNKQYEPALTTAIAEFIAAVESTIDGNPQQAKQHMSKMAAIKREVSGG